MYLVCYNEYKTRQMHEIRSDSLFYAWVFDNNISIYRFENGRFERMVIVQESRPGTKNLFFAAEWRPVSMEGRQ